MMMSEVVSFAESSSVEKGGGASAAPRYWIGVVSREHVKRGEAGSFAQLCHGKERPLRRMRAGDWLIYYSPRERLAGGEPLQACTAICRVVGDRVYEHPMSDDFVPFRRAVQYLRADEAPIGPLLDRLTFIPDPRRWGYPFRTGHFEITRADFALIAEAMGVPDWEAREQHDSSVHH